MKILGKKNNDIRLRGAIQESIKIKSMAMLNDWKERIQNIKMQIQIFQINVW